MIPLKTGLCSYVIQYADRFGNTFRIVEQVSSHIIRILSNSDKIR